MTPFIPRRYWLIAIGLAFVAAAILLWMGRPLICACGEVKLWVGEVHGPDNSQHLADWYTPSHIIHGFLFYLLGWLFLRRNPPGDRLIAAIVIEAAWEILENSQWVIDRYREATMASSAIAEPTWDRGSCSSLRSPWVIRSAQGWRSRRPGSISATPSC